ncbi:hypothetical protein U1E44_09640 [Arenibacter sp. GZD96]|uniref:hypothetical protein n=1 Tax=Aurantibrevibacter litoralis TaxID=3106030 RepID=UPI002AFEAC64|nr:hypothetical protein [Arenibacter sp. GZD-96]MEA1786352.1 hypothetical protein [Arenibacter sp. GZD-96]
MKGVNQKGINKRKLKIFLFLLLCASLIWFLSKLSDTYNHKVVFHLKFENLPDSLLLLNTSRNVANLTLRGSGFSLLKYDFIQKDMVLDLAHIQLDASTKNHYLPTEIYKKQIESQLFENTFLVDFDYDPLQISVDKIAFKKVPVIPQIEIQTMANYYVEAPIAIIPDSIIIRGPSHEIDTIWTIKTEKKVFSEQWSHSTYPLFLEKPSGLVHTEYSENSVSISAKIWKFSEELITVPITLIDLPEDIEIRLFPAEVQVLCKAKLEDLKRLTPEHFQVIADYNQIATGTADALALHLSKQPEHLLSAQLQETQVTYILKRNP